MRSRSPEFPLFEVENSGASFASSAAGVKDMESKAKLFGHPIHQMLIVFPLGLLATALIFDLIALALDRHEGLFRASFYMIAAGVIGGLVAAVFGLVDFLAIPRATRARRIGLLHGVGNVIVVVFFAGSWLLRRSAPADPATLAIVLGAIGAALATVTGWLGGELVDRLAVGVDDGAHLDAPSSLTSRTAR
jgi:uncharacterized membrane protein